MMISCSIAYITSTLACVALPALMLTSSYCALSFEQRLVVC